MLNEFSGRDLNLATLLKNSEINNIYLIWLYEELNKRMVQVVIKVLHVLLKKKENSKALITISKWIFLSDITFSFHPNLNQ